MFLIFGISPLKRPGKGTVRHHCPRCNDIRNFGENTVRNYFSLFFIPIFPISKANTFFSCPTCGYAATPEMMAQIPVNEPSPQVDPNNRVIVFCRRCEGPMFIPLNEIRQKVTCPHCTMEFVVKGIKGIVPTASVEM